MGLGYALLPAYVEKLTSKAICCRPLETNAPLVELVVSWRIGDQPEDVVALLELTRRAISQTLSPTKRIVGGLRRTHDTGPNKYALQGHTEGS